MAREPTEPSMTATQPHNRRWAQSLADGVAGTALMHLELGEDAGTSLTTMVADPVIAHPVGRTA
jgi:hypothetical protein